MMKRDYLRVSMFGVTNAKELMLRARHAGVPVGEAFFKAHLWDNLQVLAAELEDAYAGHRVKVVGEYVVSPDNGWFWLQPGFKTKLQSTVQPESFVTLPAGNEALANDMIATSLWRFFCEV